MVSDRVARAIERLLTEADAAVEAGDWQRVAAVSASVLDVDPDNVDARALARLAEGEQSTRDAALQLATSDLPGVPARSFVAPHLEDEVRRIRDEVVGERRVVTVMFVDAVGFTPLAERLDEEALYGLMQDALSTMTDWVHRLGGTVTQFRGDGVMALFGAPVAVEDAAGRAARAAIGMRDELADRFRGQCSFRIGLNTGPVVVGSISDDLQMDFTALGDTVNLAARMEQVASPGSVLATAATATAASGFVVTERRGRVDLKGKSESVEAFEVVAASGATSRFEAALARGLHPFVGRRAELDTLRSYIDFAPADRPTTIRIVGDAGIGKSRLVLEARHGAADPTWFRAQCTLASQREPFVVARDVMRSLLGIDETSAQSEVAEAIETAGATWPSTQRAYASFLLGLEVDGIEGQASVQLLVGVTELLHSVLSMFERPVILVEDIHWIDASSAELIRRLSARPDLGVVLVTTERPGFQHALAEWVVLTQLTLATLDSDHVGALAASAAEASTLDPTIVEALTAKTGGNPLFIEELTRSWVETGALDPTTGQLTQGVTLSDLPAPSSVAEVILARIDRLDPDAKAALQLASVLGREFSVRLLERVSSAPDLDGDLQILRSVALIRRAAESEELAYMFKHAITHDVVYSTLLQSQRRRFHADAASAIEAVYADRIGDFHLDLARHYEEAGLPPQAVPHLAAAAKRAALAGSHTASIELAERAGEIAEADGGLALKITATSASFFVLSAAGAAHGRTFLIRAAEAATQLTQLLLDADDVDNALVTSFLAAALFSNAHDDHRARTTFDTVFGTVADRLTGAQARILAEVGKGWFPTLYGDPRAGLSDLEQAEARIDELDPSSRQLALQAIDLARYWRGQPPIGAPGSVGDPRLLPYVALGHESFVALAHRIRAGEYEEGITEATARIADLERLGDVAWLSRIENTLGALYAEILHTEHASNLNNASIARISTLDIIDAEIINQARLNNVELHIDANELDEAAALLEAVAATRVNPDTDFARWRWELRYLSSTARLATEQQRYADADKTITELLAMAEQTLAPKRIIVAHRLRAELCLRTNDIDGAVRSVELAIAEADEFGNPHQQWQALYLAHRCHLAAGDRLGAGQALARYQSVTDSVAASLSTQRTATFRSRLPL